MILVGTLIGVGVVAIGVVAVGDGLLNKHISIVHDSAVVVVLGVVARTVVSELA